MRKGFKKFIAVTAAAIMAAGTLSLAACGEEFKPLSGLPEGDAIESNGGFVVAKGNYYYFINGIESYTSDNTYGTPIKGALYRIKREDVKAKKNTAERVIPSIVVAGTYDAGFYIYGDRVYYTTPNDVPDPVTGETDTSYMYFKSAKLDGSDVTSYFALSSNTTPYRIVSVDNTVYVMYVESNDLYSYNTSKQEKTLLADNTTSYVFNKQDLTDPTVYYTMSVSDNLDSDKDSQRFSYNQVYFVRADATEGPYSYEPWDMDYINKELNGEMPYTNLGGLLLDGRGSNDEKTKFNQSATEPGFKGHVYTLRSYENGGLYYTDKPDNAASGTVGDNDNGRLYFLEAPADIKTWDSVKINEEGADKDFIASAVNLESTVTADTLFYRDGDAHRALYVKNNTIYRADVENGELTGKQAVANGVSGATLVSVDLTTDEEYDYAYFTRSNGAGRSIERAVINGDPHNYQNLPHEDFVTEPYKPVKVLNLEHADSWYPFELIGTDLFFADADSDVGSNSFNYISTVSLANADGELMDNVELAAFTEKYDSIMSSDKAVGLIAKLSNDGNDKLSKAIRYAFMTHSVEQFEANIKKAVDLGKSETALYSEEEKAAFYAFYNDEGYIDSNEEELFGEDAYKDEDGTSYRYYAYFVTKLGEWTEADEERVANYWVTAIQAPPTEEEPAEEGLAGWAWALIGIAIAVVVVGCCAIVTAGVLKKNRTEEPKEERMAVDTTDDRNVDVYSETSEELEEDEEVPSEEPEEALEEAEAPEEAPAEAPEEFSEEETAEAPAEETQEVPPQE